MGVGRGRGTAEGPHCQMVSEKRGTSTKNTGKVILRGGGGGRGGDLWSATWQTLRSVLGMARWGVCIDHAKILLQWSISAAEFLKF